MSLLEVLESRKPLSWFERCNILREEFDKFLDFYNYKFFRFGSYIDDMYKLATTGNVAYYDIDIMDDEGFKKFYEKYHVFNELKVKQYLEFQEMEVDGKIRK